MPERSFALPLGRYSAHELRATGTRAPAALRMTCLADTTVSIIKDMVKNATPPILFVSKRSPVCYNDNWGSKKQKEGW